MGTAFSPLRSIAFTRLARLCRERALAVGGDIHTHPGDWVSQSETDQAYPMIAREGHVAIIAPRFALGAREPGALGVHVYGGESGTWTAHLGAEAAKQIRLEE